jgi:hypothetical protein
MATSPEVERWLVEKPDPPQKALRRVREIILRADKRVTGYLKYGTLIFGYQGDTVSFVQVNKKSVTLMFHRGRQIEGRFPHLEGTGPSARFMRFKDIAEVEARAAELGHIVQAWCMMMASGGPTAKARPKTRPEVKKA